VGRQQQSDNCRQDKVVQEVGWLDEGRQDQDGLPQHHQTLLEAGPRQEPNWRKAGHILAKGAEGKMGGYLRGLVGNCGKAAPPGGVTRPLLFIPNGYLYNNKIIKSQKTHNTKASITTFKLSELRNNYHKTVA